MKIRNAAIAVATFALPVALGILIVGPAPPSGRTAESTTRVGHKALYALLEGLGFEVHRFERGLESLPDGVLVAIEPGPSFLRESARYAEPLRRWLEDGHTALITLGPDPDHAAEVDDRDQLFGDGVKKAIAYAKSIEKGARARETGTTGDEKLPSRRTDLEDGDEIESPNEGRIESWDSWDARHLAAFAKLSFVDGRLSTKVGETSTVSGPLAGAIAGGGRASISATRPRTFRLIDRSAGAHPLLVAGGEPILLELEVGRGKLLLLSEPRLFQNGAIDRASHARIAVRAVERLAEAGNTRRIYFEEFSHGAREASNVIDLAFGPQTRWITLQIAALGLAWIGLVVFRRRSAVPFEVPPRRSRQEIIDAIASLYLRSGDYAGGWRRLIALSRLRLARAIGLASSTAGIEELVRAVSLRLGPSAGEELRRCLAPDEMRSRRAFVERARKLREIRMRFHDS
jgi:hypothetical protein